MWTTRALRAGVGSSRQKLVTASMKTFQEKTRLLGKQDRWNSSESTTPEPLFVWLDEMDANEESTSIAANGPYRLLLPTKGPATGSTFATSVDSIVEQVQERYNHSQQFVGGMGESDPGVWFATTPQQQQFKDPLLHYSPIIAQAVQVLQEERHGIPFGLYTSGLLTDDLETLLQASSDNDEEDEVWLSNLAVVHVSLFAASPPSYAEASGRPPSDFGLVCKFLAELAERHVVPVEVGVSAGPESQAARDLALSLGAQEVHVL